MKKEALEILIFLNVTHWAADYTHLSTKWMLDAKRLGTPILPILAHACVHYALVSAVLLFFLFPNYPMLWLELCLFQLFSHWGIDILKGRLNGWVPALQSPVNKFHWYVFGLDQMLHQFVLIIITYLATN
jgi:hypothetical protein